MLGIQRIVDGGLERPISVGDIPASGMTNNALTTAGSGTLTAAIIAGGLINRTGPAGGFTDTTDTAEAILRALSGNSAFRPPLGVGFRLMYINGVAQAMTFANGRGVTNTGVVNVAASAIREFYVSVVNNTPEVSYVGNVTNADPNITGLTAAQVAVLTPGMMITGTSVTVGTTIQSINYISGNVVMSANATGTTPNNALTFSPVVNVRGIGALTA